MVGSKQALFESEGPPRLTEENLGGGEEKTNKSYDTLGDHNCVFPVKVYQRDI